MPIGRIGTDFIVNSTGTSDQSGPAVTALADGRFVMTWNSADSGDGDSTCIRGRLFNADGSAAGDDFIVNSTGTSFQTDSEVEGLADGRFVAMWRSQDTGDGDSTCIRGRLFNADGSAVGDDFIVNTTADNGQFFPQVTALADGRFVAMWPSDDTGDGSGGCVRGRLFNADGSAAGDDFIVNTTTPGFADTVSVTTLADGGFVATWHSEDTGDGSGSCIRGRLFNIDGSAVGDDFIVNTTSTGIQEHPAMTALVDGRFVATWRSDDTGDGDSGCIRGRLFSANGTAAGDDFIVNTTATGVQRHAAVTGLADGRFVVTWSSDDNGDGSGSCVRGRLFNIDGSAAGDDFIVNTTTTGAQDNPTVTALADGRFVVSYRSTDTGDGDLDCVRAQIFDPTVFVGTSGQDSWQGGNLSDRINGGADNDTLAGLGGDDVINGDAGIDSVQGGAGNDRLFGGADNDFVVGGSGDDIMAGNLGDDDFFVDSAGDRVLEASGGGSDEVITSVSYTLQAGSSVEEMQTSNFGGTTAINLTGNEFGQFLLGNNGANTLNGGGAVDIMQGLGGDDTYFVDVAGDAVTEAAGEGADRVIVATAISYTLAAGSAVELMRTAGSSTTTAIHLTGNELVQTLQGNAAANTLNGAGGVDIMQGFAGDDTYFVDVAGDLVTEAAASGSDRVIVNASISYTLAANSHVELLRTTGSATIFGVDLHGNNLVNTIQGNNGDNVISSGLGNDTINTFGGSDIIIFNTALGASNIDNVTDYNVAADTIELENAVFTALAATGPLAASAFRIGAAAADGDDRIIYNDLTGALIYDSNGNVAGGAIQFAKLGTGLAMTNAEFVVI